jgi:hypothetical protein
VAGSISELLYNIRLGRFCLARGIERSYYERNTHTQKKPQAREERNLWRIINYKKTRDLLECE